MVIKYCFSFPFCGTELLEKKKDKEGTDFRCAGQDIKLALPPKRYLNPGMGNQQKQRQLGKWTTTHFRVNSLRSQPYYSKHDLKAAFQFDLTLC